MTRELLFTTTFETQFGTTTGWKSLDTNPGAVSAAMLAPSDFPGFLLIPGEAKYTSYDSTGRPITGVQAFTLRVFFAHAQLALATMRTTRSDNIGVIEAFFSGGYTPPAVTPGDPARIDSVLIEKVDPITLNKNETRSAIAVQASYNFTLL